MKITRIGDAPNINVEPAEAISHLADAGFQGAGNGFERTAVIGGAERLRQPRWARGKDGICATRGGSLDQFSQKLGSYFGHVAGNHQVPVSGGVLEGCMDAREWPALGEDIFDDRITKVSIPGGLTYQSHISHRPAYLARNAFNQRTSVEQEQCFVLSHTRALAASKHKSGAFHAGMITCRDAQRFS